MEQHSATHALQTTPPPGATHVVTNQVPDLVGYNLLTTDRVLRRAVERSGATGDTLGSLDRQGGILGAESTIRWGEQANQHPPELVTHDRTGHRVDRIAFHPSWHRIMALFRSHDLVAGPFARPQAGAWSTFAASLYMHAQIEAGSLCPITMTFACIPVLRKEPRLFDVLREPLYSTDYDERDVPIATKRSIFVGMGMTEKQGGSDVRSNTSRATPDVGGAEGRGAAYRITGHKWFFSAPMCDAHLVIARTEAGPSCFYVPRWQPDGSKNPVEIQRLKDKLGNRSNSSSEVEFRGAWGLMVGDEGRGIPTIIDMANYTRLHCSLSSAGIMRQALVQSLHHARHRSAFGRRLIEQPLMRSVLADLALESEAATLLSMELAAAFEAGDDPVAQAWKRLLTPAAKFWICKRAVELTGEAMEVWGGNGYVETGPMARLFREAPVNSIWEGSGNVMCLDVLRAIGRDPSSAFVLLDDLASRAHGDADLLARIGSLRAALAEPAHSLEAGARRFTQQLVQVAQACLMLQHSAHAGAFVDSRFAAQWGAVYGALPAGIDPGPIIEQAWND